MRAGLCLCIFALLAIRSPGADALEWGNPVNGLRLSISVEPGPSLRYVVENVGEATLTVPIGGIMTPSPNKFASNFRLYVKIGSGIAEEARYAPPVPISSESGADWLVVLRPGEQFSVTVPTSHYSFREKAEMPTGKNGEIQALLSTKGELWAVLEPISRIAGPHWSGRPVSNIVKLPQ